MNLIELKKSCGELISRFGPDNIEQVMSFLHLIVDEYHKNPTSLLSKY
jgi:hypothetical protein